MRTVSVKERDALMNELHSLAGTFRSRHDKLHEQASAALLGSAVWVWYTLLLAVAGWLLNQWRARLGPGASWSGLPSAANQCEPCW